MIRAQLLYLRIRSDAFTINAPGNHAVNEGDDMVELVTEEGALMVQAPSAGVLAEVYYDEGETVAKGEVLCTIDEEESSKGLMDDEE